VETRILLSIHAASGPILDALAVLTHVMGAVQAGVALVVLCAAWAARRGEGRLALTWLVLGASILAVELGVKPLLGRPRPDLWPRLVAQSGFSLPSGHASSTAAFYPFLAVVATRTRPDRRRVALALAGLASFAVGLGRLYLGVHWPTDVLAGWMVGAVGAAIAVRAQGVRPAAAPR
jgi:undecaprenyl-diphosphatase